MSFYELLGFRRRGHGVARLAYADEILVTVRGSFTASQDEQGIGWFLSRRRG
jgi:hypothetical protein